MDDIPPVICIRARPAGTLVYSFFLKLAWGVNAANFGIDMVILKTHSVQYCWKSSVEGREDVIMSLEAVPLVKITEIFAVPFEC